ncbi:hypothetical protein Cni_G14689 [Canna indica]|uniref:Complex 1 LYR protein domain-containing protein n=1 Tax=Canna indica TaxID=4628 RepID=A0AAQ3KBY1_9LILI|nr:hypothetical protein Cni_G14689 [Canna indica]
MPDGAAFPIEMFEEFEELMIPADELRQTIRQEIEKNRDCDEKQKIRFLLSEGMQKLKGLDEMLDMMGHN